MAAISRSSTPRGTRTRAAQTQVQVEPAPSLTTTEPGPVQQVQAVLHLRGATREETAQSSGREGGANTRTRIQWAEDVVDNEGLGRKSSKVCCIYHAPRGIDESSDESSSDSDDSDSGDDGSARPGKREDRHHAHGHEHNHDHGHGKGKHKERGRSPNAYEKIPKPKSGGTQ